MYLRPIDLILRAVLEVAAVVGLIVGATTLVGGVPGVVVAIAAVVTAGAAWATFRVPDDPGPAPVPVPGMTRLLLELGLLGLGALGWILGGWVIPGLLLVGLIAGHYLMTDDRVRWLLEQR
jgi:hypothetical protein